MKELFLTFVLSLFSLVGLAQKNVHEIDTVEGEFMYEDLVEWYCLTIGDYALREPVNVYRDKVLGYPMYGKGIYALPYQVIDMVVADTTNMNPKSSEEWRKKVNCLKQMNDVSYLKDERAIEHYKKNIGAESRTSPYIKAKLKMVVYNVGRYFIAVPDISVINNRVPIRVEVPVFAIVKLLDYKIQD